MNKRALAIAAATSLTGIGLIQLYMKRFEEEVSGGAPVSVLFVRKEVPAGAVLTEDAVGERGVPQRFLSPRQVLGSDRARVIGTRLSTGVGVNDMLMWTDLSLMHEDRSLADLVPDGMRAVPIRTTGFDGLLRPGDRVDVVYVSQQHPGATGLAAQARRAVTLLQNVLVLAVGGHTSRELPETARGGGNQSVTLLVTLEQSELIKVSERDGILELVLRNAEDVELRDDVIAATSDDIRDEKRRSRFLTAEASADARSEDRRAD